MRTALLSDLVTRLDRPPVSPDPDDADLLARFLADRDERAFALLVRRHGPMVFGVCRRATGNHHLAEDVFQAVFVVLAAKAGSVRPGAALATWLYRVAYQTAVRARTMSDRRLRRETPVPDPPETPAPPVDSVEALDLAAVVDEEIARLPDRLRDAVVLCELVGRSRQEAASQLGIPEGTLSSRLAAARKSLAERLRERGVALSAAGMTAAFDQVASARVPAALTAKAVATLNNIPAAVAVLSNGVIRVMFALKLKTVHVALGLVAAVVLAGGLLSAAGSPERVAGVSTPGMPEPNPKPVGGSPMPVAQPAPKPAAGMPLGPNKLLIGRKGSYTLIDPDGKNGRKVAENPDFGFLLGARLSPDGKKLAVQVQMPHVPGEGVVLKLYLRGLEKKDPWVDLDVECHSFAWSADGTEIACSEFKDRNFVLGESANGTGIKSPEATHFVVNVATKKQTALKISKDHIITDWSRDGKYFLTTSVDGWAAKKSARLHLMNRDGTEHKALTDGAADAFFGLLSPDGKRVLFSGLIVPDPKKAETQLGLVLNVLDIASGNVVRVEESGDIYSSCWSPDSKRIAYTWRAAHEGKFVDLLNKETECYLVVCDPDGKNRKTIATEKGRGPTPIAVGLGDWR